MAAPDYPDNIAPFTPSIYFGVVPIVQEITYIRVRGSDFQAAIGAKCRAFQSIPYSDGSILRDTIDAGFLGRGPVSVIRVETGAGVATVLNGDLFIAGSGTIDVTPDELATMMQESDAFKHIAPHQLVLAMTMVMYFDGVPTMDTPPKPSGNLLASYPFTQWLGDGSTIPQINGSPPPTFDPATNDEVS